MDSMFTYAHMPMQTHVFMQVLLLEPLLPGLQELHLCGNGITSLAPPTSAAGEAEEQEGLENYEAPLVAVPGFAALQVWEEGGIHLYRF